MKSVFSIMAEYEYKPLNTASGDIRLITLLPGKFHAPITFGIEHTPLPVPRTKSLQRLTKEEIEKTLPPGWMVFINMEGRFVFECQEPNFSKYEHPNPDLPTKDYVGYNDTTDPDYQPSYEALSYVWGTEEDPEQVFVVSAENSVGSVQSKTLLVRRNLASALRHLRSESSTRTLWVDAVCLYLNQYRMKCRRNLRFGPLLSEGFRFTPLD
jgi:hypothetical protein